MPSWKSAFLERQSFVQLKIILVDEYKIFMGGGYIDHLDDKQLRNTSDFFFKMYWRDIMKGGINRGFSTTLPNIYLPKTGIEIWN